MGTMKVRQTDDGHDEGPPERAEDEAWGH
jgi:hypothetical protein